MSIVNLGNVESATQMRTAAYKLLNIFSTNTKSVVLLDAYIYIIFFVLTTQRISV